MPDKHSTYLNSAKSWRPKKSKIYAELTLSLTLSLTLTLALTTLTLRDAALTHERGKDEGEQSRRSPSSPGLQPSPGCAVALEFMIGRLWKGTSLN